MLAKNVKTLKNMNATTSKFAKWYVRVVDPKVVDYNFKARGEFVAAQKFECVLVSKDPAQYMLGLVPLASTTAKRQHKRELGSQRTKCSKSLRRRLTLRLGLSSTAAP